MSAAWGDRASAMVRRLGRVDPRVAAAMRRVPRDRFVPPSLESEAYDDTPLPLGRAGSTISAPHMVALQLEWAELAPGLRVLELGSGSGYLAAVAAELVGAEGHVDGVELDADLVDRSVATLNDLGYRNRVSIHAADARLGWPSGAPYERIMVSFATPQIFPDWTGQLTTPGTLVAPVGPALGQVLRRLRHTAEGDRVEDGPECIFVRLAQPVARPK